MRNDSRHGLISSEMRREEFARFAAASEEFMVRERGKFYRPVKQQITLRLDKDVIAWFKAGGDKYQTRINEALRQYIRAGAQRH